MKKWLLVFLFLVVSLSTSIYAPSSSSTSFGISGCDFPKNIHLSNDVCAGSDTGAKGQYYCGDTEDEAWTTTDSGLGCTRGATSLPDTLTPENTCCPDSYVCEVDGPDTFKCNPSGCTRDMSKSDCEDASAFYYDTGNATTSYCACEGMQCSDYVNEENCTDDKGSAGSNDGSFFHEFECGGSYYVSNAKKCVWGNNICREEIVNVKQTSTNPQNWTCSVGFNLGICKDGIQPLNWSVIENFTNAPDSNTWTLAQKEECLLGAGCAPGRDSRACGKDLIKLPGFSLFGLVSSLLLVIFYSGMKRFKYRKQYI